MTGTPCTPFTLFTHTHLFTLLTHTHTPSPFTHTTLTQLQWGIFVVCLEWTVFVCTHTLGSQWKHTFGAAPWWVKATMENGKYKSLQAEV